LFSEHPITSPPGESDWTINGFQSLQGISNCVLPFGLVVSGAAVFGAEEIVIAKRRVRVFDCSIDVIDVLLAGWQEGKPRVHQCLIQLFFLSPCHRRSPEMTPNDRARPRWTATNRSGSEGRERSSVGLQRACYVSQFM